MSKRKARNLVSFYSKEITIFAEKVFHNNITTIGNVWLENIQFLPSYGRQRSNHSLLMATKHFMHPIRAHNEFHFVKY